MLILAVRLRNMSGMGCITSFFDTVKSESDYRLGQARV
jgi:hypothetical protein